MWTPSRRRLAWASALALGATAAACGGGGAGTTAPAGTTGPTAQGTRPSFVLIVPDDMAYGLFGSDKRFPFLELPNLERLAARGVQFERAFVTTSLCSPSRASILSGLYAHSHGVLTNDNNDLSTSIQTFPRLLQTAGYKTAFVGKWHMDPRTDGPRPGFDRWVSFRGQGVYENPLLNVDGQAIQRSGYTTDILTEYATNWLRERGAEPFLLIVSHKAVHGPFQPAARHVAALPDASLPEPASFKDSFAGKPAWQVQYARCGGGPDALVRCPNPQPALLAPWPWSPREPWRLDYLRTALALDDSVGSVVAALQAQGLSASTYVLFLSDNGFFLGEHRLGDKRLAYEESIRVPFVVAGPGVAHRSSPALALNLDVAPTVLELAGLPVPGDMQGRSLARLLKGEASSVRESFLYEYFAESLIPVVPEIRALRTPRWAYVTYPTTAAAEELYDVQGDPPELINLAAHPDWAGVKRELRGQLDRLLDESGAR